MVTLFCLLRASDGWLSAREIGMRVRRFLSCAKFSSALLPPPKYFEVVEAFLLRNRSSDSIRFSIDFGSRCGSLIVSVSKEKHLHNHKPHKVSAFAVRPIRTRLFRDCFRRGSIDRNLARSLQRKTHVCLRRALPASCRPLGYSLSTYSLVTFYFCFVCGVAVCCFVMKAKRRMSWL